MSHDIFVSYAHADDEVPGSAKYGGVTTFVEELKKVLRKKIGGSGASVWMDHHLAANERVDETLTLHVHGSRTILLFMSPGYLKSKWCATELQQFLESHATRFNKENVFVVALETTDRASWSDRVQALTPIELFETELNGVTRTLGWPYPPHDPESKYWKRMNELAHLISIQLNAPVQPNLASFNSGTVLRTAKPVATAPTVWIAQGTVDVSDEWESLASAVRQMGALVVPCGVNAYPLSDASAFKLAATNDLMGAQVLVQLLGCDPGPALGTGLTERIVLLQNEMARVLNGAVYPELMLWRKGDARPPAIIDVADSYQRLLIGSIAGEFEQFRSLVLEKVKRLMQPAPPMRACAGSATGGLTVCVTGAEPDRGLAQEVCDVVNALGAAPISVEPKPSHGQSQTEYREQFEDLLANVDGVILVHGSAPSMWLHSRHAQVRKVLAQRKSAIWGAFLDGPPPDKDDRVECRGPGLLTLSCRDGLSEPPIAHFLQQLRPGAAGV